MMGGEPVKVRLLVGWERTLVGRPLLVSLLMDEGRVGCWKGYCCSCSCCSDARYYFHDVVVDMYCSLISCCYSSC